MFIKKENLPSSSITCRVLVWSWHVWKYNTTQDGFFGHFLTQSCSHPLTTIIQTETQSVHGQAWAQQKAIYLQMAKREIRGGMVEEDDIQRTGSIFIMLFTISTISIVSSAKRFRISCFCELWKINDKQNFVLFGTFRFTHFTHNHIHIKN